VMLQKALEHHASGLFLLCGATRVAAKPPLYTGPASTLGVSCDETHSAGIR
jgi:hypothetical protein